MLISPPLQERQATTTAAKKRSVTKNWCECIAFTFLLAAEVKIRLTISLLVTPEEYAKAVRGYSRLPTGAGQNHTGLGEYLNTEQPPVSDSKSFRAYQSKDSFVTLYKLDAPSQDGQKEEPPSDANIHDALRAEKAIHFHSPEEFFNFEHPSTDEPESRIVFIRGHQTAEWLNSIGAKYHVDPEFFCRHLDFRPADDNSNNFSIPALPSSSWHLIQLPVITIGTRDATKSPMKQEIIDKLRMEGANALAAHHHKIARWSGSGMNAGDSMVRQFYTFDETHFAIEQRISICMQEVGRKFTCKSACPTNIKVESRSHYSSIGMDRWWEGL